ncbi:glucans biosynthesis protein [Corynebacterium kalinowskii]|uniref:Glucans biosynthesis protein n=1 Tax=Corynebacterium kalinowskii TaxID=2675216 RepID=A0A6B8VF81_9CORY|nr:acyltransferase family protein [Corynebacterium kalinowskii]QGU01699.1 glucans biosynthesis protein [Corynebacterium kalinowskii]
MQQTQTRTKQYLEWPDAARGLSILGVLFLHATLAVPNGEFSVPAKINAFLDPMRMPLFFVVSGFLAAKVLHFSMGEVVWKRLWFIAVPYLVWAPIELWLKYVEWHTFLGDQAPTWDMVFTATKEGASLLWFLYCLVAVTAFAWATRALSTPLALAASFAPLVFLLYPERPVIIGHVMLYLPIFMIGVRLKDLIAWFAQHALHPLGLAITAVAYWVQQTINHAWQTSWGVDFQGIGIAGLATLGFDDTELLVRVVVRILTLPAALTLAVALTKVPLVFPMLRFFGRNTLVLYIGHGFGLTLLFNYQVLFSGLTFEIGAANPLHNATVWVWACVAFSLLGGMVFHGISRIPVVGWSVKPPAVYHRLFPGSGQLLRDGHTRLLLKYPTSK